ncbi:tRNA pseudouridine synthase 1 [Diatrype stigma]|uniref:tRNA pseudouridine synthase 1 n=1 Tax=Diatrype stigma TaxID=117547 RepID=A0AAN9YT31_9PEZI
MASENETREHSGGNAAPTSSNNDKNSSSFDLPPSNTESLNKATSNDAGSNDRDKNRDRQSGSNRGRRGRSRRGPENRRERNDDWRQDRKRRRVNDTDGTGDAKEQESSYMSIPFSTAEIAAEERRPKKKVAVLIGYSGTGYHGLQINHKDKTIEGDIFAALVKANAISKANADDPRKSSFVRCARTDKGVHAAGNMISLKLIIEDKDVVQRINDALPPQIRVWGIHRTNNNFSCYQACDSRWYEYLMPSYCLLPPHPESFLGKKVLESVKEKGIEAEYAERLGEVKDYWQEVEENDIKPILDSLDPEVREIVAQRIHASEREVAAQEEPKRAGAVGDVAGQETTGDQIQNTTSESSDVTKEKEGASTPAADNAPPTSETAGDESTVAANLASAPADPADATTVAEGRKDGDTAKETTKQQQPKVSPVDAALKQIKAAYMAAKRRYRASPARIARLQAALDQYLGTRNYHNYTVQKAHGDASAKRLIKSFVADPAPIQIHDTQWLSLKVHGQSFMMHQIRKMVGMAALVTRCGALDPAAFVPRTYGPARVSIPKAPGLGLLLERPVFDSYSRRAVDSLGLDALDYARYEDQIRAFKDEHIYRRIFELEERENSFHTFFHQIDGFKSDYFLWVTAHGIDAVHQKDGPQAGAEAVPKELEEELGNEGEDPEDGYGGA